MMKTEVKAKKRAIKGKLKTKNDKRSLQGLKVMAFAAGTKKLLGMGLTDKDGKYNFEFKNGRTTDVEILVTPNVDEKLATGIPTVKKLLPKKDILKPIDIEIVDTVFPIWEKVTKTYTIFGAVWKGIPDPDNPGTYLELIPVPDVTVHFIDVSYPWIYILPPPPPPLIQREIGSVTTAVNGTFLYEFDWSYRLPYLIHFPPDIKPDILVRVTQKVNGTDVVIYEEDPATETRWNIDDMPPTGIPIIIEGDVVLPDDVLPAVTTDFEFHGVGRVLVSELTNGYATTTGPSDVVKAKDSPFGSAIDIKAQFNNTLAGNYYQVLYAKWPDEVTAPSASDFTPILNENWYVARKISGNWKTIVKAPITLPGVGDGFYEIPDYTDTDLTSKELLVRWRTHRLDLGAPRYPNGKYSLKVKVFDAAGNPVLTSQPATKMVVQVDNTWPVARIMENITIHGSSTVPVCSPTTPSGVICDSPEVCGIVYIESGKELRFNFEAKDKENHFRKYRLTYRTGHGTTGLIAQEAFDDTVSHNDLGFTSKFLNWNIGSMNQCGYEIRLNVWDRTINGYHYIHRSDDFVNLILLDMPVSP